MLHSELDRCERILDLMRDLPRHFTPGQHPRCTQLLGTRALQPSDHAIEGCVKSAKLIARLFR
jgi:hypothetical protein